MLYLNDLIKLDSSDLISAILSVNTSVLNDTSIYNFTVEISAQTESYDPLTITFNFDFEPMIREYLNRNPVSLYEWKDEFPIPVNFETPFKNKVLMFEFVDENRHLMNITLIGNKTLKSFTEITDLD